MNRKDELAERLSSFYREARHEVSTTPPAWSAGRPRRGGWLQPVLASAALVLVAVVVGLGVHAIRDQAGKARTAPAPSATPLPSSTASASPPSLDWITAQFPIGEVQAMTLDRSAIYALYAPKPAAGRVDPGQTRVARVERATGKIIEAGPFPGAASLTRAGSGLWIAGGFAVSGADTRWLILLDPTSLKVERRVHLPGAAAGTNTLAHLAGNPSLLWLGYAQQVYRLDPGTGSVLLSEPLPGGATSVSLDPSGRRLYAGVDLSSVPASQNDRVMEWDASTGAMLASAPTGGLALGGPQVAAATDGVWIAYATGMLGTIEHRSAARLELIPTKNQPGFGHSNGIRVFTGGSALWVVDASAQQIGCADPGTGMAAASAAETLPAAIAADSAGTYLGTADGVAALQPPSSCP